MVWHNERRIFDFDEIHSAQPIRTKILEMVFKMTLDEYPRILKMSLISKQIYISKNMEE